MPLDHGTSVQVPEIATPSTPASNKLVFYAKTDSRPYSMGDDGAECRLDNTSVRDFSATGTLTVRTGTSRVPILFSCVIESIAAMVNTAPTGATLIVDVNKNGTTIYGTQGNRPTVAISAFAATVGSHSVTTATAGDYITIDVDQIGSTVAGADLVVSIAMRRTG